MQSLVVLLLAALSVSSASHWPAHHPYYGGPLAAPVVLPSGYLADTPEVAHAKATHTSRLTTAAAAAAAAPDYSEGYSGYSGYYGHYAAPVVTHNGFLADTPEVAAAKAAHFAELAKAGAGVHVPYVPHVYAAGYEGHYVPDHNGW